MKTIDVIQIFKSAEWIEKPDYTTEKRQWLGQWETCLASEAGYFMDKTLVLPFDKQEELNMKTTELVIVQDQKSAGQSFGPFAKQPLFCFTRPGRPSFEIFRIHKTETGIIELYLNYEANAGSIGIPKRENHKIAELKQNKPIRYKINGKSDATLSGRKQRTYVEFDYIIEYLGQADAVRFMKPAQMEVEKKIPVEKCRLIDERQILK